MNGQHSRLGLWTLVLFMCLLGLKPEVAFAEKPKVDIQTVDGRTEATVTIPDHAQEGYADSGPIRETLSVMEGGAAEVIKRPTKVVGRGADETVQAVEKVSESAFSWIFRKLDFVNRKQTSE